MSRKLLNSREFSARINCSLATFYRKVVAGEIPRPLILGPRMRRWKEETATEYINGLKVDTTPIPVAAGSKRGRKAKKTGVAND